jgi:hypothetical protein
MEGVALSSLTLPLALLSLAACSTAALPISQFEEEEPPPSSTGPALDAGGLGPPRDAALPPRDAAFAPPDATLPPRDASIVVPPPPLDASLPPIRIDAGRPRPPDAGPPPPPDPVPLACAVRNPPSCTPTLSRCGLGASAACAYPDPANPEGLLLRTCTQTAPDLITTHVTSVPCRRSCFEEIPASFEELQNQDCARRPTLDCRAFPSDQIAVDRTLEEAAQACGLTEHHLGLIFTANGCGRALFARELKDPAIRCIGKRINAVRFSCNPLCAIANSDEE